MNFKIENYTEEEYTIFLEICKKNMKDYCDNNIEGGWSDDINKNNFNKHLKEGHKVYTLKFNSEIIGYIMISIKENYLYINELQLDPKFQKKGYGSECLSFIENLAKEWNCIGLELTVFIDNPARELYKRLGFIDIGERFKGNAKVMRKNFKDLKNE